MNQNKPKPHPFDPQAHHRRSIRLKGYDYTTPGAYFITICTYQRETLFGEIGNREMALNNLGEIAFEEWFKTGDLRDNVELLPREFVVMPNHIHGIIWLIETDPELKRSSVYTEKTAGARRYSVDLHNHVGVRRSSVVNHNHVGARRRRAPTYIPDKKSISLQRDVKIPKERFGKPVSGSIPTIVRSYKAAVTYRINKLMESPGTPTWQRNYYEHIIRNQRELRAIQEYIIANPYNWHMDQDNPDNINSS